MNKTISPWWLAAFCAVLFGQVFLVSAAETGDGKAAAVVLKVEVTGAGRPMILIPGLACGGNVWDATVAHFKGRYQCHVVTLPGFAGEPAIGEPFLRQVGEGLKKYIREQKLERPVIVGHSLGGFMAFWLGIEMPDEVGPLVAVDGVPYYPALLDAQTTPQLQEPGAARFRQALQRQSPELFAFNNLFILATMITEAKNVAMVAEKSNKSDPKAVGQAFYEMMTTDLRGEVKAIRSPVLLLGATQAAASAEGQKKQEESYRAQVATVPQHKVVFAPKSRHFIQLDAPEFFFQEVEAFLKEVEGGK